LLISKPGGFAIRFLGFWGLVFSSLSILLSQDLAAIPTKRAASYGFPLEEQQDAVEKAYFQAYDNE
jgi:hypothetical protein